jgi:hypothetical protein
MGGTVERRYHSSDSDLPIVTPCRHCASPQTLEAARVDIHQGRSWYRCARCDEWFLIRWDDAVALGAAPPIAATGEAPAS